MNTHELRLSPVRFVPIAKGENHVLLVNDAQAESYEKGDPIVLIEHDPEEKTDTGRNRIGRVTYVHRSLDDWNKRFLAPGASALSVRIFREPRSI